MAVPEQLGISIDAPDRRDSAKTINESVKEYQMSAAHSVSRFLIVSSAILLALSVPNEAMASEANYCLNFRNGGGQFLVRNICNSEVSVYIRYDDGSAYSTASLGAGEEEITKLSSGYHNYDYWACEGYDTLRRAGGSVYCE